MKCVDLFLLPFLGGGFLIIKDNSTMEYPRVLVISNNSFSLSNSNGRTMGLLFKGWPKDKLAQFCITTDGPDWDVCDNYFCAPDRKVLKSTIKLRGIKRDDLTSFKSSKETNGKRLKRTAIKSFFRHIFWNIGIWNKGDFKEWVNAFSPEVVLLQCGDTAFTHNLARNIAKKQNAKLVFFNTEGVYFLKSNYLYKGFCDFVFFPLYKHIFKKSYEKAMDAASYAFYLNEMIKRDNDAAFGLPGMVIYNTSSFKGTDSPFVINSETPIISYFGNMGGGRSVVLVEVAKVIKEINSNAVIDVYGKGYPDAIQKLEECPYINYRGFIPYDEISDVINNSDILLHVESQDKYFVENLKYGFSTKIADCLTCGRPFLLYSSRELACADYLIANDCAWFANTHDTLKEAIISILNDKQERDKKLEKAKVVAKKNHSISSNCSKFQEALKLIINRPQT